MRTSAALCTIAWFSPEKWIVQILHIESTISLANTCLVKIVKNSRHIEATRALLIVEFGRIHDTSISKFRSMSIDSNSKGRNLGNISIGTYQIDMLEFQRSKSALHTILAHVGQCVDSEVRSGNGFVHRFSAI